MDEDFPSKEEATVTTHFDVLVIGSGTAGQTLAHPIRKAGKTVAVADRRPFGGTCAIRGCQAKKYLVTAAEMVDLTRHMTGNGIGTPATIDWPELIRFKKEFTDEVPDNTENDLWEAGIETLHGSVRFTGENSVLVGDVAVAADVIVIATGAKPMPLPIQGAEHLLTSDDFLEMAEMPERVAFIGGGYISMEFAHVAARAGASVTVLEMADRILGGFDPDLVETLVSASEAEGIQLETGVTVSAISPEDGGFRVETKDGRSFSADQVIHGAGRVPEIEDLEPEKGNVEFSRRGVAVNAFMQSVSNPRVYAVGDAADAPPQLATVADMEAEVAADNILNGNRTEADHGHVPSVVFTLPPLASVGMSEDEARENGLSIKVNKGNPANWPSSWRIGQEYAGFKVILEEGTRRILGAHLLCHEAGDMINLFALAIKKGLTADDLKSVLCAYPTYTSDIKYMIR
jgi:glutathione reductase (NADPH)